MYAVVDDFNPPVHLLGNITIDETTSYVSFKLSERYQRLCLWINQVRTEIGSVKYKEIFFSLIKIIQETKKK